LNNNNNNNNNNNISIDISHRGWMGVESNNSPLYFRCQFWVASAITKRRDPRTIQ
jgi:hypothetical protein